MCRQSPAPCKNVIIGRLFDRVDRLVFCTAHEANPPQIFNNVLSEFTVKPARMSSSMADGENGRPIQETLGIFDHRDYTWLLGEQYFDSNEMVIMMHIGAIGNVN